MAKKKKDSIEYRYYEIGQDEYVLALFGESWIRDYGRDVDGFHFHNLMEIGVCHEGHGEIIAVVLVPLADLKIRAELLPAGDTLLGDFFLRRTTSHLNHLFFFLSLFSIYIIS